MNGQPLVRLGAPPSAAQPAKPRPAVKVAPKPTPTPGRLPAVKPAVQAKPGGTWNLRRATCNFLARLPKIELTSGTRLLVPVAIAVLGLVLLGFIASRPEPVSVENIQVSLHEGESRMISIAYPPESPPVEFHSGKAEVVDHAIFLNQERDGVLHVLVTGVQAGETTWSVVTADGLTRAYRTEVTPRAPRARSGDRAAAIRKIEDGDLLLKEASRDLSNAHKATVAYREACEILGADPYGKVDPTYRAASDKLEQATKAWTEAYAAAESELALARMHGDAKAIRQALANLLAVAPDERSPEYQKNFTLLTYVYGAKRKRARADDEEKESE